MAGKGGNKVGRNNRVAWQNNVAIRWAELTWLRFIGRKNRAAWQKEESNKAGRNNMAAWQKKVAIR